MAADTVPEVAALHGWMNLVVNARSFRSDPIPPEAEQALLESFRLGPSAANVQPWELVRIEGEAIRRRVVTATLDPFLSPGSEGAQGWIARAPLLLAVCLDRPRATARIGPRGWDQSAQDTFAALQNLRLTAVALGLGTAVVREFEPEQMRRALGLPFTVYPLCLVAAGRVEIPPEIPPRLPLAHILHPEGEWGR